MNNRKSPTITKCAGPERISIGLCGEYFGAEQRPGDRENPTDWTTISDNKRKALFAFPWIAPFKQIMSIIMIYRKGLMDGRRAGQKQPRESNER